MSNVTVGYYVTRGNMVYTSSFIVEALSSYGMDRLMADIRQFVPMVQALPTPAAPWRPTPTISLMLKTVLRFVGPGDDLRSCRFAELMEERLENAFAEAEAKVLNSYSTLSVEILSVSQSAGSPAVSLVYVVQNRTETLNGTAASNLLSRLTAELVGYFLFYPPLIIAEPLEYHNLNTSAATKDFWVITVIQDVENSSLEGQYQSFASLMEQRLAELFMVAHQQGVRFKRANTVGSYTVQMVGMRRVVGPKNPAELTYYVQLNGMPLPGTTAAKFLNTVDSQTMALTLGYFVQLQAEAVVKGPSNNLWIIASVLAPISIVTIIIIIITAVLCHKNKSDFKTDGIANLNPRVKTTYRRDMSYYHQTQINGVCIGNKPVQGFDYAKQHLGQLGSDEDSAPLPQAPLQIRDASLKVIHPDGTNSKKTIGGEIRKSRLPSEDGSAVSVESVRPVSVRGSSVKKISTQQNLTKEESKKRTDPYDTSSGSLQLISVKQIAAPPAYSQPASSDRSQDSAVLNGEVNLALKQKSDIEHYRNKLRLKAKRKGYYDFPSGENNASSKPPRHESEKAERTPVTRPSSRTPEYEDDRSSTYVKSRRRHSEVKYPAYRSRQSLNSPSPGGTEMDLLVMRERPRKGIRNSGYDPHYYPNHAPIPATLPSQPCPIPATLPSQPCPHPSHTTISTMPPSQPHYYPNHAPIPATLLSQPCPHPSHTTIPTMPPSQPHYHLNHAPIPATLPSQPCPHPSHTTIQTMPPSQPHYHPNHAPILATLPSQPCPHPSHTTIRTMPPSQAYYHPNYAPIPATRHPNHAHIPATLPSEPCPHPRHITIPTMPPFQPHDIPTMPTSQPHDILTMPPSQPHYHPNHAPIPGILPSQLRPHPSHTTSQPCPHPSQTISQPCPHPSHTISQPCPHPSYSSIPAMPTLLLHLHPNKSGQTEPEIIAETDVDGLAARRHYGYGRQAKGHSETSTLSSQPSIDEVRQQMHLLLEEAFSLASAGHTSSSRRHHYQQHQAISPYSPGPSIPYSEGPTSAPDTINHTQGGLQWVPAYGHDLYQCSLSKPTFRFTQLPEMVTDTDSPPPPVPPRTGPVPRSSLQRSSSDVGPKAPSSQSSVPDMQSQQDNTYVPISRGPLPPITTEPVLNHSGNPMTAVYAIPTSRQGYPGYFLSTPPSSYHSPSWMSYPPEPEDVSTPWTDSVPLPGYAEAFPNPRYPRGSVFQWTPSQAVSPPQVEPDQPFSLSTDPTDVITPITLSTSALVQAIRDEVAKLAKKQADMFEFQV
ncbi:UPF0606 protein KIAA1549L isoform X2 [Silurus meridionalis]|nr:UPF0606 protein KIAA1549L isoform X2 [Silurus meridionalis]